MNLEQAFISREEAMRQSMQSNCMYCKNSITIDDLREQVETGIIHAHYCRNCVEECNVCHQLKQLYAFPYDEESMAWQRWRENNCLPHPAPPEAFGPTCSQCIREQHQEKIRQQHLAHAARLDTPSNRRLIAVMRARMRPQGTPGAARPTL